MSTETGIPKLRNRRVIEALRSGVPSGDAVSLLGCNQPDVEREFNAFLSQAAEGPDSEASGKGMLVSGDFGAGKSHLLSYLETQALAQNFVCSRIVISKETPLFDIDKVFKSAVENARAPGVTGHVVEEIAGKSIPAAPRYGDFFLWANQADNGLHRILPATLMVYERLQKDYELFNQIARFWSGETIRLSAVRDGLRQIGQLQSYPFRAPVARDMPPQKLRFVLELIKASGHRGWVVLMDEIELVANYSVLQRARSYAELTRWMGQAAEERYPGLILVGTVTADFASVVLDEKGDRQQAAARLRSRQRDLEASRAETGMRLLERNVQPLVRPDDAMLIELYRLLRQIHSDGYEWAAPEIDHGIGGGTRRQIRSFVRRWINEWDLRRLYPDSQPAIEETELQFHYDEDRTLEQPHAEDDEPSSSQEDGESNSPT